ncbi:50S ribosomal protein L9 [Micrococcoides hystricis]|uniref:Large ribosomal subunit protein bL9 n=1 Tax=Micrococcoides hystricis TaxID=1572761 RepID=A0ABV6PBE0_9MICC
MAKLILNQEVTGLGAAGDVVEVKNGYARNYLLPRGIATLWTAGGEKQIESIKAARAARAVANREEAQALAEKLSANAIDIQVTAGETGRLFGTVKGADVAAAIEAAGLGKIDKRSVEFAAPIKQLGTHKATVRVHEEVVANIELNVIPTAK